ncbi:MAG TPA: glycosyltransferase [Solirubrobacteraceae bacterium]|nr:glycosyltransferase [Solirubrobacteraceae bacterium]
MRVLHVITGLRPGGAERQLLGIARHTEHDIEVAALASDGPIGDALREMGVPVHFIGMHSNRDPAAFWRLSALAGGFDLVAVHLYRACVWARPAARLGGVGTVVTTEHSIGTTMMEGRLISPVVRGLYVATERYSDRTIAVSAVVRDRLVAWGVPPAKIACVPNGIDLNSFSFDRTARRQVRAELGIGPDERVIGSISRLVRSKRVVDLVRAARSLGHIVIVGDGPERAAIEVAGVGWKVHTLGERADVQALLSAFDVFVAPSMPGEETFGLAALEAAASGLPVVVSACPALDGLDCPLVRWAGHDLRADIEGALRMRRATEPPAALDRYSIGDVVSRIDALYRDVWGAGRGRRPRSSRIAWSSSRSAA